MPGEKLEDLSLIQYVRDRDSSLYARINEVSDRIQSWLEYIPATFPHYTSHTIRHSKEIIRQISFMFFESTDCSKPAFVLTTVEAYLLALGALLHDSGMVCSDDEKEKVVSSPEWMQWLNSVESRRERIEAVNIFREGNRPADKTLRHFIADRQVRYLVADFIRQRHHLRSAEFVKLRFESLGTVGLDNPTLTQAIADICAGHGLSRRDLDDNIRYPLARQILGQRVNLRLVAVVLRLGDLLDLSNDRACPLLLDASGRLPYESQAHWEQYRKIFHQEVSPDKIEIRAKCDTAEQHRVLRDWCQWIVDETIYAPRLLTDNRSTPRWRPPLASMEGDTPTITIDRSEKARYLFKDWQFELDPDLVIQRLSRDAYRTPTAFIRELLQNAADATRCRVSIENVQGGDTDAKAHTDASIGEKFPIRVSVHDALVQTPEGQEHVQEFLIEDCGIGMSEEVIKKYLLQIGRSFYQTAEFRSRYSFTPVSRFGIGFLSVFAVSNDVMLETATHSSMNAPSSVRLHLTGPRNYILVEESDRRAAGTSVRLRLKAESHLEPGKLTEFIRSTCKRLEFPILVSDHGTTTEVRAEKVSDFVFRVEDVDERGEFFELRALPLKSEGVQGELYQLIRVRSDGAEDWAAWLHFDRYRKLHMSTTLPELPQHFLGISGLGHEQDHWSMGRYGRGPKARIDVRSSSYPMSLDRSAIGYLDEDSPVMSIVSDQYQSYLDEHIAQTPFSKGKNGWRYLNRLHEEVPPHRKWDAYEIVPVYKRGKRHMESVISLAREESIQFAANRYRTFELGGFSRWTGKTAEAPSNEIIGRLSCCLFDSVEQELSERIVDAIFSNDRLATRIWWLDNNWAATEWRRQSDLNPKVWIRYGYNRFAVAGDVSDSNVILLSAPQVHYRRRHVTIINRKNVVGEWLSAIISKRAEIETVLDQKRLLQFFTEWCGKVAFSDQDSLIIQKLMNEWNEIPRIPKKLKAPNVRIVSSMFQMTSPGARANVNTL